MNKQVATTVVQEDPIASIPAIIEMADRYKMSAKAFVYTFRTVAMPQPHTDAEFVSCCLVAHAHGLNPLTKELYFMKTKGGGIQAIVSVDGWAKKCNEHQKFDGMEFADEHDDKGQLISTTCVIYRSDRKHPVKVTEYLDECLKVGGPVWRTNPRRMLRHRSLTQCARYAFGFAGVMDRDEFDQWQAQEQGMKDVTPKRAAIVDDGGIPDIPDKAPADDTSDITDPPVDDEPLAEGQQEVFLEKLAEDVLLCMDDGERATLAEDNAGMLDRLSDANRRIAESILEGRSK